MSIKLLKYFSDAPEALIDMASPEFAAALLPSQGIAPGGGVLSYSTPSRINNLAIPLGNNVLQVTQDWAVSAPSVSSGLVAFINGLPDANENLTHFDLFYNPILALGNISAQSARVFPAAYGEKVRLQYAFVLFKGSTGSWYKVGGDCPYANTQAQGTCVTYVPIQNPNPSCPTAAVTYKGRFIVPTPTAQTEPTRAEWFKAIADIKAGVRPKNTVGIAVAGLTFPVQIAAQAAIPSTNLSLDGPILLTSPHFTAQRGYGSTQFPPISIIRTDPYSGTGTAAF